MTITFDELNAIDGERRKVLIAFSKKLRVLNKDEAWGLTDKFFAGFTGDADLKYLVDKQDKHYDYKEKHQARTVSVEEITNHINQLTDQQSQELLSGNDLLNKIIDSSLKFKAAPSPAAGAGSPAVGPAVGRAGGPGGGGVEAGVGGGPRGPDSAAAAGGGVHGGRAGGPGGGPGGGGPEAGVGVGGGGPHADVPLPPPPAAGGRAGGPGGGPEGGAGNWWSSAENMVNRESGAFIGGFAAGLPVVGGFVKDLSDGKGDQAIGNAGRRLEIAAKKGAEKGLGLDALGAGFMAGIEDPAAAAAAAGVGGGDQGGDGGGGQGGAAAAKAAEAARLDAIAKAAAAAARLAVDQADAAAAAAAAAGGAAGGRVPGDEEAERKKQLLELLNTSSRPCLQVFDEYDQKKKQYDAKLEKFLGDDPTYKENKDSMFTYFVSPSDKPGANNAFLPYVTKTDFHKILNKASFANTASRYAVACKMELKKGEEIEMGASTLSDQCFIDVQDSLNHTRIFLSKQNFKKLEEYKKNLVKEFKELLENDNFKDDQGNALTKDKIQDKIFEFGSIKAVKEAIGVVPAPATPPNALSSDSLASIVGLTSADDIDKYAQILADQFWQRKLMKGDLSVEAENTSLADGYDEAQRLGHIKIVRTDKDGIKVYKVGSDDEIGLDHVNLGMGNQMMQIEVKKITKDGVTGVQCFGSDNNNNFNKRIEKKDHNETVNKAKVDVFVEDLASKKMSRLKIRKGADKSKPITKKANKIVTPLSGEAPKIFTLEKDGDGNNMVQIGKGTIKFLGTERVISSIDIKITKDKNGKFVIQYGDNKMGCASYLSNYRGGFLFNYNLTSVEGHSTEEGGNQSEIIIQKEKKWNPVNPNIFCKKERKLAVQVEVLDKETDEKVTLEIRKKGSRDWGWTAFNVWRARNELEVKVASKVKQVPRTVFDPQSATSFAPIHSPGRAPV